MPVRILIADDHATVRKALRMLLESQSDMLVVGEAANGWDALAQAETHRPDVILMDISMPELDGIEATRLICERLQGVKVIILSMLHTKEHVFQAQKAGALAYLLKESAGSCIVDAIYTVMKGCTFFSDGVEAQTTA